MAASLVRSARSLCFGWLTAVLQPLATAQAPLPDFDATAQFADRLCVKLAEGSGAEWKNGHLISRTAVDLQAIATLFARPGVDVAPLISSLSWDELDQLHRQALELPPQRRPGHLGLWFRLRTATPELAAELRVMLANEPRIEHVYHEPRLFFASAGATPIVGGGGDIPPTTPSFTSMQGSHTPPPAGHDLRVASAVYGARGQGVVLHMVETSWLFGHEDVARIDAANFLGPLPPYDQFASLHGLSGASLLGADRNAYGITGVADEADLRFIAMELNGGMENAMLLAAQASAPGDLMMIVVMVAVPGLGPGTFLPFEFYQASFDATATITAMGRHVVVPAANGNRSLDDPALLQRFDRSFRDSGAIIVGASAGALLQRAPYCNWGARIDAHSWGDGVVSCGYGGLFFPNNDMQQSYTAAATGTSSATPHIAGIVAMLQGAAQKQLGQRLTPAQVLTTLHTYGLGTPDVIGRRVDVVQAFTALGIFDGLRLDAGDVDLGGSMTATMDGPAGSIVGLYASFAPGDFALGFNRNVHLDLFGMVPAGAFLLPAGTATWTLPIPNDPQLHGAQLYLQGVRLFGSNPLYLTNSCQLTVL